LAVDPPEEVEVLGVELVDELPQALRTAIEARASATREDTR
jgi:hypothetical protein